MSAPWLRLYRSSLHNPKIVTLTDRQFRAWHNCLLITDDNGILPCMRDIAVHLRMSQTDAEQVVCELLEAGLLDVKVLDANLRIFSVHDWGEHQFTSDSSKERVERYRERRKAAGFKKQQYFNTELRAQIFAKNNGECVYCGTSENLTVDHMTPLHRGGAENISNYQPACRSCNADKRNMTHEEYSVWPGRNVSRRVTVTQPLPSRPKNSDSESESERTPSPSLEAKREFSIEGFSREVGSAFQPSAPSPAARLKVCKEHGLTDSEPLVAAFLAWKPKIPPRDADAAFIGFAKRNIGRQPPDVLAKIKLPTDTAPPRAPSRASSALIASLKRTG